MACDELMIPGLVPSKNLHIKILNYIFLKRAADLSPFLFLFPHHQLFQDINTTTSKSQLPKLENPTANNISVY